MMRGLIPESTPSSFEIMPKLNLIIFYIREADSCRYTRCEGLSPFDFQDFKKVFSGKVGK